MGNVAKDLQAVQKIINGLESKIDQKKSERHSILKQSKMEDIVIPMSQGNMEDIDQDGNMTDNLSSAPNSESMGDSSSVANSQAVYDRENR